MYPITRHYATAVNTRYEVVPAFGTVSANNDWRVDKFHLTDNFIAIPTDVLENKKRTSATPTDVPAPHVYENILPPITIQVDAVVTGIPQTRSGFSSFGLLPALSPDPLSCLSELTDSQLAPDPIGRA
jgi:hypothetical protein